MMQLSSWEAASAPRHLAVAPAELASSSLCRLTERLVHGTFDKAAVNEERTRGGRGAGGGKAPAARSAMDRDRLRRDGRATLAAIQKAVDTDLPSGNAEIASKPKQKGKELLVEAGLEGSTDKAVEEPGWKASSCALCRTLATAVGRESPRGSESSTTEGASMVTELSFPSEDASSPGSDLGQSCSLPQDASSSSPLQLETARRLRRRRRAGRVVVHEATEGSCVVAPGLQPQAVGPPAPVAPIAPPPGLEAPAQAQAALNVQMLVLEELQASCAAADKAPVQQEEPSWDDGLLGEPVTLPAEMAVERSSAGLTSLAPNSRAPPATPHVAPLGNKAAAIADDRTVLIPKHVPSPQEAVAAVEARAVFNAQPYGEPMKAVAIADVKVAQAVLTAQLHGEPLKVVPLSMLGVWPEMRFLK